MKAGESRREKSSAPSPSTSTKKKAEQESSSGSHGPSNNAPQAAPRVCDPPLPTRGDRWTVWRIWNAGIHHALDEHFKTGNFLLSHLALAKLFLDKLGIWELDSRFHVPMRTNFRKVTIVKAYKFQSDLPSRIFWIKSWEVECAQTVGEKRKRIVELNGDMGELVRDMVQEGDYIVVWGGSEQAAPELKLKKKMMLLNEQKAREPSFLAIYRHNGELCYPMATSGYIENNVKAGGLRQEFSRGESSGGTDVVHVQRIVPAKSTGRLTWRLIPQETETKRDDVTPVRRGRSTEPITAPVAPPVALVNPPPLFTSTPVGPPPRPSPANGEKPKNVRSPLKTASPQKVASPPKRLPRFKKRPNVVDSDDDDDDVREVERNDTAVVTKSKTNVKTPPPVTVPSPRRRGKILAVKLVDTGKNIDDYAEMDDEEDEPFEDAEDAELPQERQEGNAGGEDSDSSIPVVDIADEDGSGDEGNTSDTTATFVTADPIPGSSRKRATTTTTPGPGDRQEKIVPTPDVGAEIEVSTTSSIAGSGTEVDESVKDTVSELVGSIVHSESQGSQQLEDEPISLEEILELDCIRRMCANTVGTNENGPPGPSGSSQDKNLNLSGPTPPDDLSTQDPDPIMSQMIEMHYGSPSGAASSSSVLSSGKKGTLQNSNSFANSSTQSQTQGGSRRNLFTQELGGVFTQVVMGRGEKDSSTGGRVGKDRKRPHSPVAEEEVSTDELSNGRSQSQLSTNTTKTSSKGKKMKKVPPPSPSPDSRSPTDRVQRCRAGMSHQSQELESGTERNKKPIFPMATQDRIHGQKDKDGSRAGSVVDSAPATETSHQKSPQKKRGRPVKGSKPPASPARSTRSTASTAGSAPPTPIRLTAKRTRKNSPGKGKGTGTASTAKGGGGTRALRNRKKK